MKKLIKNNTTEPPQICRPFEADTPIYYRKFENELLFSDTPLELAKYKRPVGIDLCYLQSYLAYQAPLTSRTLFSDVRKLAPGETVSFSANSDVSHSYTMPNSEPISPNRFKQLLVQQLSEIVPEVTGFHISSGLDSSLIALISAQIHPAHKLHLYTCITRGKGASDEVENCQRLVDNIGADLTVFDFTDVDVFSAGEELIKMINYPLAHPSHLVEYLLDKNIVAEERSFIVNGKGPDDCLAGYPWHSPEYMDPYKHQRRLRVTPENTLTKLVKHPLHKEIDSYWHNCPNPLSLTDRLLYDARALTDSWNVIHHGVAKGFPVQIISPFMLPEIRLGCFALSDNLKYNSMAQKLFMRKTFSNLYPDFIKNFQKTGLHLDLAPYFKLYDCNELVSKICVDTNLAQEFFNLEIINAMIKTTIDGTKNQGWQLWSIFMLMTAIKKVY